MVQEFYASYVVTVQSQLDRSSNPAKHTPLQYVRVRGKWVDISLTSISRILYGMDVDATRTPLTAEFD